MTWLSQKKLYLSIGAEITVFATVALIAYRMGEKEAEYEVSGEVVEEKILERQPILRKSPLWSKRQRTVVLH